MSKYELSDALVANVVGAAEGGKVESHLVAALISDLKPQIPLPAPTKIGAVVRTSEVIYGKAVFVRVKDSTHTAHGDFVWVALNDPDTSVSTAKLGRIVEVLSEGVDL